MMVKVKLFMGPSVIRGTDAHGSGAFGARRGKRRRHRGVDICAEAGTPVFILADGIISIKYRRTGKMYPDSSKYVISYFEGLSIGGDDRWLFGLGYVCPFPLHPFNERWPVGLAQDIAARYPGITPHIHFMVWKNGVLVDPTEIVK